MEALVAGTEGKLDSQRDNFALALEYHQKRLTLSELFGDNDLVVSALSMIEAFYREQHNYVQALVFAERASILAKQISSPNAWSIHIMVGLNYRSLGQLDKARLALEETIIMAESSRTAMAESSLATFNGQWNRDMNLERMAYLFEYYIDVMMQLHKQRPTEGYDALALQANERARARLLLELLNEALAHIRQGVDPQLLERERSLQQQLNDKAEEQALLPSNKQTDKRAITMQIDALSRLYKEVQAQIRRKSPRYTALTQPVPLTVREIQRDLLDADTVLLEYTLAGPRSYLWVITQTSLNSYELPIRSEIEKDVRRVVALLKDGKRWASDAKINAEYLQAAAPLSRKLLPPALLPQLKGKRLVIVSEGALQYLPFGALPMPQEEQKTESKTQKTENVPFAVEHEIVSLPSASTLAVLRREATKRKRAAKSIAVFADPVFTDTDERLATIKANHPKSNEQNKTDQPKSSKHITNKLNSSRSFFERAYNWSSESNEPLPISRLPFTRREAEAILAVAPASSWMKAVDFKANRTTALSSEMSQYRIVHFATHGLLHSEHPELSGIVLSLVNEQGQPVDGFLRLNEIYNLNLSADLVVLSACETALGKEIRGEGLIGLTRGFMYAGSPRVVASLWKVDDVATAELMKLFYRKMLQEKMRPAAALRAAKVEMWKQKRWNAPFYWAAFEIQGEWR